MDMIKNTMNYEVGFDDKFYELYGTYPYNDYILGSKLLISMLETVTEDKYKYISQYIYDMGFGECNSKLKLHDSDKYIDCKTYDDLYELLFPF